MKFREDIQGLRAIAVILVFLFHLNSNYLSGGFIGVDIFFVISGYLITTNIIRKKEINEFKFIDFYLGRIKRLIPVYIIFLLIIAIAGAIIWLPADIYLLRRNLFHASIFNSNNYLMTLDNYFGAASSENPLLHTWTLSIEMQFYFILPLLLILVKNKYHTLLLGGLTLLLFAYSIYNTYYIDNSSKMYFSLPARMPELLLGCLLSTSGAKHFEFKNKIIQNFLAILSVLVIILCAIFYNEQFPFPGIWVIIPLLAVCILLKTVNSSINTKILSNKILVHIGKLSYSIYLWHWAIMAFIRYYYSNYEFSIIQMLMIILVTYILSYLSFTFIEDKFRKSTNKNTIIFSASLYSLMGVSIFAITKLNAKVIDIPEEFLRPKIHLSSHGDTFKEPITLGASNPAQSDSILLIGDSHALMYKFYFEALGKEYNFNFRTATNNLYPPFKGISKKDFTSEKTYEQYLKISHSVQSELKNAKYIILCSVWSKKIPSLEKAYNMFIKQLGPNQKVIILQDFPVLKKFPMRQNRGQYKIAEFDQNDVVFDQKLPSYVIKTINDKKQVYYLTFDFSKLGHDWPYYENKIMYFDGGHLNLYGINALYDNTKGESITQLKKIIQSN
ncbi:acyltransferase family protein [Sphingobacterium lactis]|nr:acyltransferase family protein [Sphingobacterium lactis]